MLQCSGPRARLVFAARSRAARSQTSAPSGLASRASAKTRTGCPVREASHARPASCPQRSARTRSSHLFRGARPDNPPHRRKPKPRLARWAESPRICRQGIRHQRQNQASSTKCCRNFQVKPAGRELNARPFKMPEVRSAKKKTSHG